LCVFCFVGTPYAHIRALFGQTLRKSKPYTPVTSCDHCYFSM